MLSQSTFASEGVLANPLVHNMLLDIMRGVNVDSPFARTPGLLEELKKRYESGAAREYLQVIINGQDLPRVRAVLRSFVDDEKLSPKERRESGKALIQLAQYLDDQEARKGEGSAKKPVSAMTGEELRDEVARLEAEMASRALPVPNVEAQLAVNPAFE